MAARSSHQEIAQTLIDLNEIAVISHMRPDGDAVGSSIALGLALQALGKRVHVWIEDGVPERFRFLEGAQFVTPPPNTLPPGLECVVCLDCGEPKRLGGNGQLLVESAPLTINIDHHETNTLYATMNLVQEKAAACACVLAPLLDALGVALTPPMAAALYVAVNTDTGSFQYSSTTPEVMRLGARLIEVGVDVGDINRRLYQELPLAALHLQREVLCNMELDAEGLIVHYSLTIARRQELHLRLEDTKDLVDIIRVLRGAKVALIFEELEGGLVRISLRSKDPAVRVNDLAAQFGGGGHPMAAGIRMRGTLGDVRSAVLQATRKALSSRA